MSLGVAPFDRHKAAIPLLKFEILFHFPNKSDDVACGLVFFWGVVSEETTLHADILPVFFVEGVGGGQAWQTALGQIFKVGNCPASMC